MAMCEWQLLFLVWDTLNDHARRGLMKAINHNLKQLFVSNRVEKIRIVIAGPGDTTLRQMSPSPPPFAPTRSWCQCHLGKKKVAFEWSRWKNLFHGLQAQSLLGFKFVDELRSSVNIHYKPPLLRWTREKMLSQMQIYEICHIYCKWKYLKRSMWSFVKE